MKQELVRLIASALKKAQLEEISSWSINKSPQKKFGDYATNVALIAAEYAKKKPREVAQMIAENIPLVDSRKLIEKVEIAGPGFINLFVSHEYLYKILNQVIQQGPGYGKSKVGEGRRVLLEFVSANPTGPLHIGHGRWAAIGDSLANILDAAGFKTSREFYVNDRGKQIQLLVESVKARTENRAIPDGGYGGEYVKHLAARVRVGGTFSPVETLNFILEGQKQTLENLHVKFDHWFSEQEMHAKGEVQEALELLKKLKHTYEKEGALWFKSTDFGDDKDRVLVKSDGELTYFASDVAYHMDKYKRGFDHIINIFGADHHGYVARLKAAVQGLGFDVSRFEVIIGQLVSLYRGKEQVRVSKRTGEMITLEEVIEEIGIDAARYFLIMRGADTHLDFDLELAKKTTLDNPVYYVQYAHARICSIFREAADRGYKALVRAQNFALVRTQDFAFLTDESELDLIRKIADFPDEIAEAALARLPHRLTTYVQELVTIFHSYYHKCRVLGDDKELSCARLALCEATRIVIKNTLNLLGVSAPDKM